MESPRKFPRALRLALVLCTHTGTTLAHTRPVTQATLQTPPARSCLAEPGKPPLPDPLFLIAHFNASKKSNGRLRPVPIYQLGNGAFEFNSLDVIGAVIKRHIVEMHTNISHVIFDCRRTTDSKEIVFRLGQSGQRQLVAPCVSARELKTLFHAQRESIRASAQAWRVVYPCYSDSAKTISTNLREPNGFVFFVPTKNWSEAEAHVVEAQELKITNARRTLEAEGFSHEETVVNAKQLRRREEFFKAFPHASESAWAAFEDIDEQTLRGELASLHQYLELPPERAFQVSPATKEVVLDNGNFVFYDMPPNCAFSHAARAFICLAP